MQKAKRNGVRHKQDDNEIIQQNYNIKISEANLAIEQLHEKLDRISNKNIQEINTIRNELHRKIDHESIAKTRNSATNMGTIIIVDE